MQLIQHTFAYVSSLALPIIESSNTNSVFKSINQASMGGTSEGDEGAKFGQEAVRRMQGTPMIRRQGSVCKARLTLMNRRV